MCCLSIKKKKKARQAGLVLKAQASLGLLCIELEMMIRNVKVILKF